MMFSRVDFPAPDGPVMAVCRARHEAHVVVGFEIFQGFVITWYVAPSTVREWMIVNKAVLNTARGKSKSGAKLG